MTPEDNSRERFEQLWAEQGYRHLQADPEWRGLTDSYKMRTWRDYALFIVPLLVGVVFIDRAPIHHEMLRWLVCAVVVIVVFVICAWIKTVTSHAPSAADIERRVKERCYERYKQTGQL